MHAQCLSFKGCLVKHLRTRQSVELGLAKGARCGVRRQHGQVCRSRLCPTRWGSYKSPVLPVPASTSKGACALPCLPIQYQIYWLQAHFHKGKKFWCFETGTFKNWQSAIDCNTVQCKGDTLFERGAESSKQPCWKANIFSGTAGRQYVLTENLMNASAYTITKDTWGRGEIMDTFSSDGNGVQLK